MSTQTLAELEATMEEALAAQAAAASELKTLREQNRTLAAGLIAQDAWFEAAIEVNRRDRSDAPGNKRVMARATLEISHYKMVRDNLLPAELLELARRVAEEGRG